MKRVTQPPRRKKKRSKSIVTLRIIISLDLLEHLSSQLMQEQEGIQI